jgi:hypothetical protein
MQALLSCEDQIVWNLIEVTERVLILFKYSDFKEELLKQWTIGFSINLYSIARVFYDHGLNTFETIG